eukprot:RCo048807
MGKNKKMDSESSNEEDEEEFEPSEDDADDSEDDYAAKSSSKKGAKPAAAKAKAAPSKAAKKAGAPTAKVDSLKDQSQVESWVLDFLNKRNRPYSALNVVDLSGGTIKKAAAEKALATLAEVGKLTCKELKKQKLFMAKQDEVQVLDTGKMDALKTQAQSLGEELAELEKENRNSLQAVQHLESQMTDQELDVAISAMLKSIAEKKKRLDTLKAGSQLVDPAERATAENLYERARQQWKKRKRIAREMVDIICGETRSPQEVMQELGIETDEEAKITLEETEVQVPSKKARS